MIGGRIVRAQVLGGIISSVRGELDDVLTREGVPLWVREKVVERTQWLGPVVYGKSGSVAGTGTMLGTDGRRRVSGLGAGGSDGSSWEVASELTDVVEGGGIEEIARRLQEFWHELEEEVEERWAEDVAKEGHKGRWRRKASSGSEGESEKDREDSVGAEKEKEASEKDGHDDEETSPKAIHVRRVMEAVEKTVCSLYYDR